MKYYAYAETHVVAKSVIDKNRIVINLNSADVFLSLTRTSKPPPNAPANPVSLDRRKLPLQIIAVGGQVLAEALKSL